MGGWPLILPGRLRGGKLELSAKRLAEFLRGRADCELEVVLERKHATRSHAQNRLYWGVYCEVLSEHTGYTKDEIHELLKAKFLPKKLSVVDTHGEIQDEFTIGGTTTRLNKLEFGEYLRSIQQWAAETLDVVIPDPDESNSLDDRKGPRQMAGAHS